MLEFHDLANGVVCKRLPRFIVTDQASGSRYEAADAQHAARVLERLSGCPVTEAMFYALRCKEGTKAGALRWRFSVDRCSK